MYSVCMNEASNRLVVATDELLQSVWGIFACKCDRFHST
jgi:hypothetical protein